MRSAEGEFASATPASLPGHLLFGLVQANVGLLTRDGWGLRGAQQAPGLPAHCDHAMHTGDAACFITLLKVDFFFLLKTVCLRKKLHSFTVSAKSRSLL